MLRIEKTDELTPEQKLFIAKVLRCLASIFNCPSDAVKVLKILAEKYPIFMKAGLDTLIVDLVEVMLDKAKICVPVAELSEENRAAMIRSIDAGSACWDLPEHIRNTMKEYIENAREKREVRLDYGETAKLLMEVNSKIIGAIMSALSSTQSVQEPLVLALDKVDLAGGKTNIDEETLVAVYTRLRLVEDKLEEALRSVREVKERVKKLVIKHVQ